MIDTRYIARCAMWAALLAGCESVNDAASKAAAEFQGAMQSAQQGNESLKASSRYEVRGRVLLRNGQTLTCFNGIPAGYLGPPDMASPGQGNFDAKTGRASLNTAAIPATVLTRSGTLIANQCDKLAAEGVLQAPAATLASSPPANTLNPRTACRDVPTALQSQYRKCVSFDPADHCSALPIDGTWLNGQTDLAAICDSRKTKALMDREAQYQRSIANPKK